MIREGGKTLDRELWDKLCDLLGKMSPTFDPSTQVKKAAAIKNDKLRKVFVGTDGNISDRHMKTPLLLKKENWKKIGSSDKERVSRNDQDRNQRRKFHDYLCDFISLFDENEDSTVRITVSLSPSHFVCSFCRYQFNFFSFSEHFQVPVVPMIQGTNEEAAKQIVNSGFGAVAKIDDGYCGQGGTSFLFFYSITSSIFTLSRNLLYP